MIAAYTKALGDGEKARDEAEIGWGGVMGLDHFDKATQPLARYALQQGWPITRTQATTELTTGMEPGEIKSFIADVDKRCGGDRTGQHILPINYAQNMVEGRHIFIAKHMLPTTLEDAIKYIHENPCLREEIVIDYDIQVGGDGTAGALWSKIPEDTFDRYPQFTNLIMAMRTPYTGDMNAPTDKDKLIRTADTYANQIQRTQPGRANAPGPLNLKFITANYHEE
jgi:hypothetical protein